MLSLGIGRWTCNQLVMDSTPAAAMPGSALGQVAHTCVTSASEFTTVWRRINLTNLIYCKKYRRFAFKEKLVYELLRHSSRDISVQNASDYQ